MANPAPLDFAHQLAEMSALQDVAALQVMPLLGDMGASVKLCGGTALSRFYLQHRISYDLDFFVPLDLRFDAQALANTISTKLEFFSLELTHDPVKADPLHFLLQVKGAVVKISFIEDAYAALYPPVDSSMVIAGKAVQTEPLAGLYHRKLRTVVGWADSLAIAPAGGRQTARDMFDLYVLSNQGVPLRAFIESVPYAFPTMAFEDGLANMPWWELAIELKETLCAPQWADGVDIEKLQKSLYQQLGMTELPGDDFQDTFTHAD